MRNRWEVFSGSESVRLLVRQAENSTSGLGSFRERSAVGTRFPESLFLDVPRTTTEQVRTFGFGKKIVKFRKSTQEAWLRPAKFLGQFFSLPSISSATWVMYSSAIPELNAFCDWSFLVFSCVPLETAANFLFFLKLPQNWGKGSAFVKTELIHCFQNYLSQCYREEWKGSLLNCFVFVKNDTP